MAGDIAVLASALLPAEVTSSVQIYEDVAGKAGACKRFVRGFVNSADLGRQCKTLNIDGQWATRYDFIQQGRALGDDLYKNFCHRKLYKKPVGSLEARGQIIGRISIDKSTPVVDKKNV